MGTAAAALALVAVGSSAHADPCTGVTDSGGRFATCFDVGNRLSLVAGTDGYGAGIALRHIIDFDDAPDLVWKMDHTIVEGTHAILDNRFSGVVYRGHYIRHARDGHIVLPLGTPKKVFLPFDIGALVEVGNLTWRPDDTGDLGVVKTAALIDFARARDFRTRFAIGPVASWDVALDRGKGELAITDHRVAPFSAALAEVHVESRDGLSLVDLRVESGMTWHSTTGWSPRTLAEASLERIVLAVNDRPISLVAGAHYDSATHDATIGIGLRIVLLQRLDPRVSLDPPGGAKTAALAP